MKSDDIILEALGTINSREKSASDEKYIHDQNKFNNI
jgi:hypothetical protein